MAQAALEKLSFTRNDASAQYGVLVSAVTSDAVLVYPEPFVGRFAAAPFWSRAPVAWQGVLPTAVAG